MKTRNYYFDNLKAFLIITVVLGHLIEVSVKESHFLRSLFLMVYTFHMPLFIFVSGFFSKSCKKNMDKLAQRTINYFILYIFFQVSIFLLNKVLYPDKDQIFSLLIVDGIAWYLLSLAFWHILLIFIKNLKAKYVLPFLIILSLLFGYVKDFNNFLSISRVIVYAPFFYLGYYLPENKLSVFYNPKWFIRLLSFIGIIIYFFMLYKYDHVLYKLRPMFTGKNSYEAVGLQHGALIRLLCYAITIVTSVLIMFIIPKRKIICSFIGQRTLQIYFIHKYIIMIYYYYAIQNLIMGISVWSRLLFIPLAVIISLILSIKIFSYPFNFITKLPKKLYKIKGAAAKVDK